MLDFSPGAYYNIVKDNNKREYNMKTYLLSENGNFYKANLHCHTTLSDGRRTPEQIAEMYRAHGYSVVAFTDHNIMIPHPELCTDDFLALTGYEININSPGYPEKDKKSCHVCFIALDDEDPEQPLFTSSYLKNATLENEPRVKRDRSKPEFIRNYDVECINEMIRIGRDNRFFVTYNHPAWSLADYNDYMNFHGMNAMEIANYGTICLGLPDYNDRVYNDMLNGGERIFCIATDDNHNKKDEADGNFDSFGGWTMIKADKLDYRSVTSALEAGNFYASMGPEIKSLWFEDGEVHITTSPAATISLITGIRYSKRRVMTDGEPLTHTHFKILPNCRWFRIDVVDEAGCHANTNAYFVDQFTFPEETEVKA